MGQILLFNILGELRKKWFIVILLGILCSAFFYIEKQYVEPIHPKTGIITYTMTVKLNDNNNMRYYMSEGKMYRESIVPFLTMWSNQDKFLRTSEEVYDYNKFNANWDNMKKSEKFAWLNEHLKCKYVGNNIYEFVFGFKASDAKDDSYVIAYGEKFLQDYLEYAKNVLILVNMSPSFTVLDSYAMKDEIYLEDVTFVQKKYAIIGFILGAVLGITIVFAIAFKKTFMNG